MAHIHEKIDFTTEAFVVHKGKVLLRMHDKYNLWLPPGGHIELDEDPCEAVVREVKEEVGLDIELKGDVPQFENLDPGQKIMSAPRFMARHRINDTHEHVCMYFFATSNTDQVTVSGEDVSNEWRWFSETELADPKYGIRADIAHFATQALRELS